MATLPYIAPFLAFQNEAQTKEAVALYTSLFPNSEIGASLYFEEGEPGPAGQLCAISFSLNGQAMMAIAGGPYFTIGPGISLYVSCESQAEMDRLYEGLAEGGQPQACGWVTDRFGISWQICPAELHGILAGTDEARRRRTLHALWQMEKLDAALISQAANAA